MSIVINKSNTISTIEAFSGTCSGCPYSECHQQHVNGAQNTNGTPQSTGTPK